MKVFKFGGASINSIERIQNLAAILNGFRDEKILIVISAMGKITNALEKVAEEFFSGKKEEALLLFEKIRLFFRLRIELALLFVPLPGLCFGTRKIVGRYRDYRLLGIYASRLYKPGTLSPSLPVILQLS